MKNFLLRRDARFVLFGRGPEETSWRGVGLLAVVFVGSLVVAALLTPPAYWLVESWHARTGSANAQWLLDKGVDVYFDRLRMILIVLGLPWLLSVCHLWSRRRLGLASDANSSRNFALGLLAGIALVGLLAAGQMCFTGITPRAQVNWLGLLLSALAGGLILGLLEETIFRGLILRIFYTSTRRPWLALAVTSAFFAYTHFKVPTSVWQHVAPGVHGDTGFFVAYWTTFGITENFDLAQFIALWLLGMVLGALTLRTGSLTPNIGLHAGLVAAMIFYRGACSFEPGPGRAFWGGGGLTDGWAAVIMLGLILLVIILRKDSNRPRSMIDN
jgi:membrane protease YdiL (CAAX protease family)